MNLSKEYDFDRVFATRNNPPDEWWIIDDYILFGVQRGTKSLELASSLMELVRETEPQNYSWTKHQSLKFEIDKATRYINRFPRLASKYIGQHDDWELLDLKIQLEKDGYPSEWDQVTEALFRVGTNEREFLKRRDLVEGTRERCLTEVEGARPSLRPDNPNEFCGYAVLMRDYPIN